MRVKFPAIFIRWTPSIFSTLSFPSIYRLMSHQNLYNNPTTWYCNPWIGQSSRVLSSARVPIYWVQRAWHRRETETKRPHCPAAQGHRVFSSSQPTKKANRKIYNKKKERNFCHLNQSQKGHIYTKALKSTSVVTKWSSFPTAPQKQELRSMLGISVASFLGQRRAGQTRMTCWTIDVQKHMSLQKQKQATSTAFISWN